MNKFHASESKGMGQYIMLPRFACMIYRLIIYYERWILYVARSSVEVEFGVSLLYYLLVGFFEIFWKDNISVFTNSLHTSLLSDSLNIGS